jgi:predicted nucleotidyltransferase
MTLQMENRHLALVREILGTHLGDGDAAAVYAFGSRVRRSARRYSDLDLAVDYHHEPLPFKTGVKLAVAFEESLLPFKVDVVDLATMSPAFKSLIAGDLVRIPFLPPATLATSFDFQSTGINNSDNNDHCDNGNEGDE